MILRRAFAASVCLTYSVRGFGAFRLCHRLSCTAGRSLPDIAGHVPPSRTLCSLLRCACRFSAHPVLHGLPYSIRCCRTGFIRCLARLCPLRRPSLGIQYFRNTALPVFRTALRCRHSLTARVVSGRGGIATLAQSVERGGRGRCEYVLVFVIHSRPHFTSIAFGSTRSP